MRRAIHPPQTPIRTAWGVSENDRVRIAEGTFQNVEGDVVAVDESSGRITIEINIFGRQTPIVLEARQVEPV